MTKQWDVLALGNVAVDDLVYVPHYPPADAKVQVLRSTRQCGGLAATALVAASRLGAYCAYGGSLGYDELSAFVENALRHEGVNVEHVVRREDAAPSHSVIIVDTQTGTRNVFYEARAFCGADEGLPLEDVIRVARVLFIDRWGEAGTLRAARIARASGIPIVADIERSDFDAFDELFSLADHLIVSEDFALLHTRASTPEAAVKALWNSSRDAVIVTCGARGGVAVSREYSHLEPRRFCAFEVEVMDTTGCGDVFHGAYAACLARGMKFDERIRFAAAAAALKATQPGGQSGIPTHAVVKQFLETH
jgi:sulfofructose kinase